MHGSPRVSREYEWLWPTHGSPTVHISGSAAHECMTLSNLGHEYQWLIGSDSHMAPSSHLGRGILEDEQSALGSLSKRTGHHHLPSLGLRTGATHGSMGVIPSALHAPTMCVLHACLHPLTLCT